MRAFDLTVSGSLILSGSMKNQDGNSIVSNSAQIGSNISGSLGANAAVIRTLDRTTLSGSLGANAAVIRSLNRTTISGSIPQALATNSSPTFAAGTITGDFSVGGTLTAQEVHTEFESASILFTSGSTRFGDDTTDKHRVTGSMDISGSLNIPHGDLIVTDNIGIGTNNPSNVLHLEFNDDSDVFTAARITDNSVSGILINNLDTGNGHGGMLKFANKNGDNHTAIAHSQDGNPDASLLFYSMDGGTLAEVMRVDHTHRVGIGDGSPGSPLDVKSSESANTANFNSTNGATNITFESDGTLIGQMEFSGPGPSQLVTRTSASLALGSNNVQTLFITDDDKVGIGTNSPDAGLDLRDTMKLQTNTVPASLIVGTNDTTDHTGQDSALAIDFRNLSTTNGVAGGLVGLDKDGLELSKILLVTDNHDANTSSIRMFTSTNAAQRTQMMNINNDGVTVGGGSSAQRALHVQGTTGMCLSDGDRDRAAMIPLAADANSGGMDINVRSGGSSTFAVRVTSAGQVGIGTNNLGANLHVRTTGAGSLASFKLDGDDGTSDGGAMITLAYNTTAQWNIITRNQTSVGNSQALQIQDGDGNDGVFLNQNATSFSANSDERMKENIVELENATDKLNTLRCVNFTMKHDSSGEKRIGLIAQDVLKFIQKLQLVHLTLNIVTIPPRQVVVI